MPTHYSIAEVEDKIVAALGEQMADYVKTCKSYQGDLAQELDKVLLLAPAALVAFKTRTSKRLATHGHSHRRTLVFTVYLVAEDLRGETEARGKSPGGIYAMVEDCDAALLDQTLGLDTPEPIYGGDAKLVLARRNVCVFAVEYVVEVYKV